MTSPAIDPNNPWYQLYQQMANGIPIPGVLPPMPENTDSELVTILKAVSQLLDDYDLEETAIQLKYQNDDPFCERLVQELKAFYWDRMIKTLYDFVSLEI